MASRFLLMVFLSLIFLFCQGQTTREQSNDDLVSYFTSKALELDEPGDLLELTDIAGQKQLVLLGEASHGTHEYYYWRAEMSKQLITEKGFNFIAVEGDWASLYRLNKYVMGLEGAMESAREVLQSFNRWPEWMWSNSDILLLADWLKEYNEGLPQDEKVGFYGMDVYGQWEAMDDLLQYSKQHLPDRHGDMVRKLNCFASYGTNEWEYARAVAGGHNSCEYELQRVVEILREKREELTQIDEKAWFRAKQNALVVKNAESFYRLAVQSSANSWNSRVDHMWLTIERLLDWYGDNAKGIVWAHNTHVGDSRATSMGLSDQYNIGNLSRNHLGEQHVFIVGFGTRKGKVNAGRQWGDRMQIMNVPDAQQGSLDYYLGQVPHEQFYILFDNQDRSHHLLSEPLGHRAIGVTYNPRSEAGNYVPTLPAYRYDALIFIENTSPLVPVE